MKMAPVFGDDGRTLACPSCGESLDGVMYSLNAPSAATMPRDGDLSVCVYCTQILRFVRTRGDGYRMETVPPDEFVELSVALRRHLKALQRAIKELREEGRI